MHSVDNQDLDNYRRWRDLRSTTLADLTTGVVPFDDRMLFP